MDNALIVDHLQQPLTDDGFEVVRSALSMEAIPEWDQIPAAFVHPWMDEARGPNRFGSYAHSQTVDERFAVVIVCAIDELEGRRLSVMGALLKDPLPGQTFETDYVKGEILDLNRTAIWWRDIYSTSTERRFT